MSSSLGSRSCLAKCRAWIGSELVATVIADKSLICILLKNISNKACILDTHLNNLREMVLSTDHNMYQGGFMRNYKVLVSWLVASKNW